MNYLALYTNLDQLELCSVVYVIIEDANWVFTSVTQMTTKPCTTMIDLTILHVESWFSLRVTFVFSKVSIVDFMKCCALTFWIHQLVSELPRFYGTFDGIKVKCFARNCSTTYFRWRIHTNLYLIEHKCSLIAPNQNCLSWKWCFSSKIRMMWSSRDIHLYHIHMFNSHLCLVGPATPMPPSLPGLPTRTCVGTLPCWEPMWQYLVTQAIKLL